MENQGTKTLKQEVCSLLQSLNQDYEIHAFGSDKEYEYLQENDCCITVRNPNCENPIYIDLENDEELTLSYYKWHAHYLCEEWDYHNLCEDLKDLLNNRKCVIVINSSERWLRSELSETKMNKNFNYQKMIKELSKEAQKEINKLKGTIELFYWDRKDNVVIDLQEKFFQNGRCIWQLE